MCPVIEPTDILTGFKDIAIDAIVLDGATGSLHRHISAGDEAENVLVVEQRKCDFTLYFPKKHHALLHMFYEDGDVFTLSATSENQKLSSDSATITEFPPDTFFRESAEPLCRLTLEEYTLEKTP